MKEGEQCGNCAGIFSFLSEPSTVLCVALYHDGWGGTAVFSTVSAHAVLFMVDTGRVSAAHLFGCRWKRPQLHVAACKAQREALGLLHPGFMPFKYLGPPFVTVTVTLFHPATGESEVYKKEKQQSDEGVNKLGEEVSG